MRAARLMGQTTQRLVEGWTGLHYELYRTLGGPERACLGPGTRGAGAEAARGAVLLAMAMAPWLMVQYVERVMAADIVDHLETELDPFADRPEDVPPGARVPAIAFVDISGFTALTEASGNDAAGRLTARFEETVARSVSRHGGRVVKWLGDGAVLQFVESRAAVEAVRAVRDGPSSREGLMPHAGIDCGPIVERDGDVFGRTVNLASRLASLAGARRDRRQRGGRGGVTGARCRARTDGPGRDEGHQPHGGRIPAGLTGSGRIRTPGLGPRRPADGLG